MKNRLASSSLAALCVGLLASVSALHASPIILIQDGFADGARTNGADANDIAWFYTNTTLPTVVADAGFASGQALDLGIVGGAIHGRFTPTSLAVGDSLTLSFNYRLSAALNTGDVLRFGLLNTNGSPVTTDTNGSTGLNGYIGYMGYTNPNSNSVTGSRLIVDSDATNRFFNTGTLTTIATGPAFAAGTNVQSITLTLLRESATEMRVTGNVGGGAFSGLESASNFTSFDALGFRLNSITTGLRIGDVNVTYTAIPEPASSAALVGAGLLAFAGLRRRRSAH